MILALYSEVSSLRGREGTFLSAMSPARIAKLKRLQDEDRRATSIGVELLLQEALRQFGVHTESPVLWETDKNGKPYLPQYPHLHFNLSHSGSYALCAMGEREVGADIQVIEPRHTASLARRFFTQEEQLWINSRPESEKKTAFFRLWACKESYLKYTGKGLAASLTSFSVNMDTGVVRCDREAPIRCFEKSLPDVCMAACGDFSCVKWIKYKFDD